MRLLLDTHALLWGLADDARVGPRARDLIADPENEVLVSAVALWEIVIKQRVGKLDADCGKIIRTVQRTGLRLLAITPEHLRALTDLPAFHRDPFDHLLIAQAIAEGAVLVSNDRRVAMYPAQVVPCSGPADTTS